MEQEQPKPGKDKDLEHSLEPTSKEPVQDGWAGADFDHPKKQASESGEELTDPDGDYVQTSGGSRIRWGALGLVAAGLLTLIGITAGVTTYLTGQQKDKTVPAGIEQVVQAEPNVSLNIQGDYERVTIFPYELENGKYQLSQEGVVVEGDDSSLETALSDGKHQVRVDYRLNGETKSFTFGLEVVDGQTVETSAVVPRFDPNDMTNAQGNPITRSKLVYVNYSQDGVTENFWWLESWTVADMVDFLEQTILPRVDHNRLKTDELYRNAVEHEMLFRLGGYQDQRVDVELPNGQSTWHAVSFGGAYLDISGDEPHIAFRDSTYDTSQPLTGLMSGTWWDIVNTTDGALRNNSLGTIVGRQVGGGNHVQLPSERQVSIAWTGSLPGEQPFFEQGTYEGSPYGIATHATQRVVLDIPRDGDYYFIAQVNADGSVTQRKVDSQDYRDDTVSGTVVITR